MTRRYRATASSASPHGALARRARATGVAEGLIRVASCGSTMDLAREALTSGVVRSVLVIADSQRNGRGRRGARWSDEPGRSVLMSVGWTPDAAQADDSRFLGLAGALAAVRAIRQLGVAASLKWPNDILVGGRKLGGVLVETRVAGRAQSHVVLGVGINILATPLLPDPTGSDGAPPLALPATSLAEEGWRGEVSPELAALAILEELAGLLTAGLRPARRAIVAGAREVDAYRGVPLRASLGGEEWLARSSEIGDEAELVLRLATGEEVRLTDSRASIRPAAMS